MEKKNLNETKSPVKLRQRKLANGNISLYLDIYRNGKRDREFLKLYLVDAKTKQEKERNHPKQAGVLIGNHPKQAGVLIAKNLAKLFARFFVVVW